MRVCTYNVRHGLAPGRRRPDQRLLLDTLPTLEADVIGLQEVDRFTHRVGRIDQQAAIAERTGFDTRFGHAIDFDGGSYGLLLGVRGTITASEVIGLPGSGERRITLVAVVRTDVDGCEWAVGCTHLTTVAGEVPGQLSAALDGLAGVAAGRPAVLLGDLNAEAGVVAPVLSALGWTAAPSGATHPSKRPLRRIDWVAFRGARVQRSTVVDVRASDHLPVVVDLLMDGSGRAPYPAGVDDAPDRDSGTDPVDGRHAGGRRVGGPST